MNTITIIDAIVEQARGLSKDGLDVLMGKIAKVREQKEQETPGVEKESPEHDILEFYGITSPGDEDPAARISRDRDEGWLNLG